jgi:hypothetical protein
VRVLSSLKPMVVVLTLALIVFAIIKPICLRFMEASDFSRRRAVWFTLTCTAFVAPNFWLYAAVALPVLLWAAWSDRHPIALYLFVLLTVPPAELPIPMPLINQLFELSPYRILALAVLLPAAVRILKSGMGHPPGVAKVDFLMLAYGALQLVLFFPYESATNTMRRAFLFGLDTYLVYFVFSRGAGTRAALEDAMASFWTACAVLVPIVVFETVKGWLMYTGIPLQWGDPNRLSWLLRAEMLRAQGSAGHSLTMGYLLAVAFGFWLYLGGRLASRQLLWGVGIALWLGLLATFSRGPWVVAAGVLVVYLIGSPTGQRHLGRVLLGIAVIAVPFAMTSAGQRILSYLPFVGEADQENVDYRQQLAAVSWRLIKQNPYFGDPFALSYMEELRQGQGIIDLVNTYASVSLFYGLVGCALFLVCLVYPSLRTGIALHRVRSTDTGAANLGAALVACMMGTLVTLATTSFIAAVSIVPWVLAGLCSGYLAVVQGRERAPLERSAAVPVARAPTPVRGARW